MGNRTYTLNLFDGLEYLVYWVIVDSLEEAKNAACNFDEYKEKSEMRSVMVAGDIEISDEDGNIYTNDIEPDTDEDDAYQIEIPDGKFLVVYSELWRGGVENQELYLDDYTGDIDDLLYGYEEVNYFGYEGISGLLLTEDAYFEGLDFDSNDCIEVQYAIYDSEMNLVTNGDLD